MIRPASNVSTSLKLSAHLFKLNSYQDITQGSFAPPVQRTEEDKREEEEEKEECENIQVIFHVMNTFALIVKT